MKRYLGVLLLLVSSLSFALTPVTINSASINYTTHTLSVVGSGFCTGALPAITFNTTRLKVTSACSSSVVVASLPVQAAGSYRLIIVNSGGASATFYVTYGAVGPQGATGSVGPKGATGLTGATGLQGAEGATGLTGATGAQGIAGQQGLKGETGTAGAAGVAGAVGATGAQGPQGLTGAAGATGATGSQGLVGTTGAQGIQGLQGPIGLAGANGTNGTGFNFMGAWQRQDYNTNDVVTYNGSTYVATTPIMVGNTPDQYFPGWTLMAAAGVGVTTAVVPAGIVCPLGGDSVTDASGNITYICNGLPGLTGAQGAQGTAGANGNDGAQGSQGPQGTQGVQGTAGTNGTNGNNGTGFNFTGPWSSSTTYGVKDVATFGGSSYVATVGNVNEEPDLTSVATASNTTMTFTITDQIGDNFTFALPDTMNGPRWPPLSGGVPPVPISVNGVAGTTFVYFGNGGGGSPLWFSIQDTVGEEMYTIQLNAQPWTGTSTNTYYDPQPMTLTPGVYTAILNGCQGCGGGETTVGPYSGTVTISPVSNIYWNVLAQAGTTGPQGTPGSAGLPGLAGSTGPQGPTGATGSVGPQGQAGPAFYSLSGTLADWLGPIGSTNQYGVYSNDYGILATDESGHASIPGVYAATSTLPGSGEYFANATIMWANTPNPMTQGVGAVNIECLFAPANGDTGNPSVTTNVYSGTIIPGGGYTTLTVAGIVAGGTTPSINCTASGAYQGLAFSWLGQFLVTYTPVASLTKF